MAAQRPSSRRTTVRRRSNTRTVVFEADLMVDGLPVHVLHKHIKSMNLRVKPPDGHVEVSVPLRTSDRAITAFVRSRRSWIAAKQAQVAESTMAQAAAATPEQVKEWRAAVEAAAPTYVAYWEQRIGVRAGSLAYRNMTSRWGSCQPATGRICLNVRLALYPPECLEYVVVHELCHLLESGHGPRFKALLDRHLPDWRERAAKLV